MVSEEGRRINLQARNEYWVWFQQHTKDFSIFLNKKFGWGGVAGANVLTKRREKVSSMGEHLCFLKKRTQMF